MISPTRAEMAPEIIDLVRELRETLGLFAGAMPISPKEAWEEAIREVVRLRRIEHARYVAWVSPTDGSKS
jgi:hypothetical protein